MIVSPSPSSASSQEPAVDIGQGHARPGPDGRMVIDFNRAENPPCAFTPYATCPLAPPANRLDLVVAAGEQVYNKH